MKNIFLAVLGGIVGEETYYERLYQKTKCQNIMWNGEQIPFAVEEDGTKFSNDDNVMLKYVEKREELSVNKCMRKCMRYAGCVSWNFLKNEDEFDICELYSTVGKVIAGASSETATRGYYSEYCDEVDNFYDFRMKRSVSIVFQKLSEFLDDDVRKNLMRTVLTINDLKPDDNGEWKFTNLHNKHSRDVATSEKYNFEVREFQQGVHTMCTFIFNVDRFVRVKSENDYAKDIEKFFGSDDIFISNLFKVTWPKNIKLYDIDAQPSDIRILAPKEFYGVTGVGRGAIGDEDGICQAIDGTLDCSCATGLIFQEGTCRDIDECQASGPLKASCSDDEECFNFRGSYSCIAYPTTDTFTETASQRIAILVGRLKQIRRNFSYKEWLLKTVAVLEEIRDGTDSKIDGNINPDCSNSFDLDTGNDLTTISRAQSVAEWFTLIYKRTYWVFMNCDSGSKPLLRKIKKMYKATVPRVDQLNIFENLTEEYLESAFSPDYDESLYDNYFDKREEKIEQGLIAKPKTEDQHEQARIEFEQIDWSWTETGSDYDSSDYYSLYF